MALTDLDEQLEQLQTPKQDDNPFGAALREAHEARTGEKTVSMNQNIKAAKDTTPDRAAEVRTLSEKTGLPPAVIDRNFDDIKKKTATAETPYGKILKETPHLAAQLAEDPDTARIAHDDLEQLGLLEWMFTAPQRAFAQAVAQQRVAELQTQRLFRELNQEELDTLNSEKFYSDLGGQLGAGDSWFRKAVTGGSQLLVNIGFGSLRAGKGAAIGAGAGAIIGGIAGGASTAGPGAVPGALQGARFGYKAGALIEGARYGFELEAGLAYDEFLDFKDENGVKIDPDAAKAAAFAAGVINAGIEFAQLEKLAETIPGFEKLKGNVTRGAIRQALRNPTVRAALGDAVKTYGKTLAFETATEVGQRAVTILAGELAKGASGAERLTFKEIGQDLLNEGIGAAQSFALVSAPGPVMRVAHAQQEMKVAQANVAWFNALGEAVAGSKTQQRAPEVLEQLAKRATEQGPIKDVYAPTSTWREYWQSKDVDPDQIAEEVTGRKGALEEAERNGTDLTIPTARYASKLAGTEHNAYFAEELRLQPDEMNGREARALAEEQKTAREQETAARDQDTQANARAQIRAQLTQQLQEQGRYTPETAEKISRLVESAFGQMAQDADVDPYELFAQYGLQVQRPDLAQAAGQKAAAEVTAPAAPAPTAAVATEPTDATAAAAPVAAPASVQPTLEEEIPGLADLEASTGGAQLETLETSQENASGESDASLEALSRSAGMKARGEQFGVYNRAGQFRPLIGPDAVDYKALRGETYGIQGPGGFRTLEDRGGRIPSDVSSTTEPQVNAGPAAAAEPGPQAGAELPGGSRERPAPDTERSAEGAGDGGSAERRRLPTSLEINDLDAYPQGFKPASAEDDAARLTEPVRNELGRIAEELKEFGFQAKTWTWLETGPKTGNAAGGAAQVTAGAAGSPVYDDILNYSPLNAESQKSIEAEKGDTVGTVADRTGFTVAELRAVNDFGRRTNLKEGEKVKLPRGVAKEVTGSRGKMAEAVAKALETGRISSNLAEGATRVAERRAIGDYRDISRPALPPTWGIVADTAFTDELSSSIDDALEKGDQALEEGQLPEGATDFDISEFGQNLLDLLDQGDEEKAADAQLKQQLEAERQAQLEGQTVDTLDTGEQQPRLPEAGAVREQNVATPEMEAPFSLTSPVDKSKRGKQTELFQDAYHGSPHIFDAFSLHAIGTGEGANAYGWGLYFASRREVAEYYRENLAGVAMPVFSALTKEENEALPHWIRERIANAVEHPVTKTGTRDAGTQVLKDAIEDFKKRIAEERNTLVPWTLEEEQNSKAAGWGNLVKAGELKTPQPWLAEERIRTLSKDLAIMEKLAGDPELFFHREKPGRTYKVQIPEDDQMLLWDLPASEQPPAVQAALRELGVTWTKFKTKSLAQMRQWFNGPTAAALAREDIGIREALREGHHLLLNEEEGALRRWQTQHQGFFNQGNTDPTGEYLYGQLQSAQLRDEGNRQGPHAVLGMVPFNVGARLASEALAKHGVAGIKYLDGGSRARGEGSHNYVVFDDQLVKIQEFFQSQDTNDLVIAHNLTAANLRHALKLGGLPVPSFAITPSHGTSTNYGEITLLGDKAMADPQGYAKTQVFGADVYSPRYPTIHYKLEAKAEKVVDRLYAKWKKLTGASYFDMDELQKEGARYFERSSAPLMAEFLEQQGIDLPESVPSRSEYKREGDIDQFQTRYAYEEAIRKAGLQDEYADFAAKFFQSLEPTEKIFKGFTNQGNKSYKPHTLENVVKELKANLRGGEVSSNIYGVGQLRSKFTPRFRTLKAIRAAKDRIVPRETFETLKEEINSEFFEVADSLRPYYKYGATGVDAFRYPDTVMAVMEDSITKGLSFALKDYGFDDVPADVQSGVGDFLSKLRTLPTEYFEAKILREVDLAEFAGAAVPEGTDQDLIDALEKRGVKVKTYAKDDKGDLRRAAVQALSRELGDRVLFQPEREEGKRGSLVIGPGRQMTINLFEKADLSTFLHESGHLFLEVMGDLVERLERIPEEKRTTRQKRLVSNYQAALEQLGVERREQIGTEQHEKWARLFEAYLMEGKAPSLELRDLFSAFRAWMLSIYRSLKSLNAPLTDEVRQVFDRMLADDEAIAVARERGSMDAMFSTAEQAGMTPQEFALYREAVEEASKTAREQLDSRHLAEVRREQEEVYKARREEVQAQVQEQAYQSPVYRALAAIRYGKNPDGTDIVEGMVNEPYKLSKDRLLEMVGADRVRRLPRPLLYVTQGGLDPAVVAERFGFSSADEMLQAIEGAEPMHQAIEREVSNRMNQEAGLLLDGGIIEAAQAATANEDRDLVIKAELRALAKLRNQVKPFVDQERAQADERVATERRERTYERRWLEAEKKLEVAIAQGEKQQEIDALKAEVASLKAKARGGAAAVRAALPNLNTVRDVAADRIAQTRIKDLNPSLFWASARRSAMQALEAAARQDFDEAIRHKTAELMATALYREAEKAKKEVDDRVKQLRDLGKPAAQKRLGLSGTSYLEQINGILDRFELAKVSLKELAKRARFVNWIDGLQAAGATIELEDFPPEIVNDAFKTNYQELPVESFYAVSDGARQILHLSRMKNRLLKAAAERDYAAVRDKVIAGIKANKATKKLLNEFRPNDERRHDIADWFASHTNMATLARIIDGGEDGGAFWEAIIRPMNAARDVEQARKTKDGEAYRKVLEKRFPGRQLARLNDKVLIPAIGGSLSLEGRLAVALNWGNQTSRDRLLADPRRKWTEVQVEAILDTLTKADWDFVQDTWDFVNTYWPEIAEKQERVTGVRPEKVEALAVRTKHGEYRGGYYPLKYDGRLNAKAQQNETASEARSMLAAAYVRSTTKRGHVEARKQNVKNSIRLDLGVAFEHIEQVIHDLAQHEFLLDANKLLRDPQIANAIIETHGDQVLRQFTRGMQDIALGSVPPRGVWERAAKWARTGSQLANLGLNLWTSLQQPLGLFNGARRVGSKWVVRGMTRWLRDAASMESTTKWIVSVSPFMANRIVTATQDINDLRASLKKPGGWFDQLVRTVSVDTLTQQTLLDGYMWHISAMQRIADVPTWLGAYEKARAEGSDEARAVHLADQAVVDSQGSGAISDLSSVQRGGEIAKLFMAFYSYGATVFNQTRDVLAQTNPKSPASVLGTLADLSMIYVMPAAGTVLLANLTGRGDDDDLEEFFGSVAQESLATAMNTMIFLRELGGLVRDETRGYAGPAGTQLLEGLYRLGAQVKQGQADEALAKAANKVAGLIFRYPATQIQKTIDGYIALEEGRTKNPLALLFGAPPKEKR